MSKTINDRPKVVVKAIKAKLMGATGELPEYQVTLTFEPGPESTSSDPGTINDTHFIFMLSRPLPVPHPCSILSGLQPTGTGDTRIYTLHTDFAFPKPADVSGVIFNIDTEDGTIDNTISGANYTLTN